MAPWEDFDVTFYFNKDFVYDGKTVDQILANRRMLEDQLFVDRLLGLIGIKAVQRIYPPRTNSELRHVYKQIISSPFPNHYKQAVIYYILRDCRAGSEASAQFARGCYLPEKYRLFIDGLWHLDRLDLRRAIEYLSEPSLIPTFPDEILYVLTLSNLPKHDDNLTMAYYLTVSPALESEKTRRAFFETLCRSSITEAFYFSRQHDEENRHYYLQQLISFVLSTDASVTRKSRAMELVNLPLDDQEEQWFENYLLHGTANVLPGGMDTVLMRRFATGKLQNLSAGLEWLGGRKVDGIDWEDLRQSINQDVLPTLDFSP